MSVKNETFKSPLHDATPTWNGFSYQGKVGLYVCLKLIVDSLKKNENIDNFCDKYQIEFEWLEDFSILEDDQYISHHQVKHYNESAFGKYIDAFVTILARHQGRLAEIDLYKYLEFFAQVSKEHNFNKDKYINHILSSLIQQNVIDTDRFIKGTHCINLPKYSVEVLSAINHYLSDFNTVKEQYRGKKIYVHTSRVISSPTINISKYTDIEKSKISLKKNSNKTLIPENIFCSFDPENGYELGLSDEDLSERLRELANSILTHLHPNTCVKNNILDIYLAQVKDCLGKHIEERHQHFSDHDNTLFGKQIKLKLEFSKILEYLRKEIIDESKDEYWELICRKNFENAYQFMLDTYDGEYIDKSNNLKRFYKLINDKYIKKNELNKLLKALKPHISINIKGNKNNCFHQHFASEGDILSVFLIFLSNLNIDYDDCLLFSKNKSGYQASSISVSDTSFILSTQKIKNLKHDFKDQNIFLSIETDFIVINSPNEPEFESRLEKFIEVENVLDYDSTENNHLVTPKTITFLHYENAQEKLNGS